MNTRRAARMALVVSISLLPLRLFAADVPAPLPATGMVSKEVLDKNLDGKLAPLTQQLNQIQEDIKALRAAQTGAVAPGQLARLQDQVNVLQQRLSDLEEVVRDIARRQVLPNGSVRHILDVAKSSDDPTFLAEMTQVIRKIPPAQGTLRINNEMSTDQDILVNGVRYRIYARTARDFTVPAGMATTQLPDLEPPKYWMIGPPNFFQQVNITPRVLSPVILEPIRVYSPLLTSY